jgi:hypothetical protein
MNNNDTYVLKINLNEFSNNKIENLMNELIQNSDSNDEIIIMSKKEYNQYIFNNSGTIIPKKIDDDATMCTICHHQIKNNNKIFRLNLCYHKFHHKCIKKWFETISNQLNAIHHCPTCRSSYESIVEL